MPSFLQKANKLARYQWFTPNFRYLGSWDQEDQVGGQSGQIIYETPPISKITRAKQTGGVAQVVEHLLCKHKVLNSNPNPATKKNNNNHLNFFFPAVLEFKLRTFTMSHCTSPFSQWVFSRQGLENYLPGSGFRSPSPWSLSPE
jgi:hypothetical protein